jgi:hypothetical protein
VIVGCPESRDVARSGFSSMNQVGAAPAEWRLSELPGEQIANQA